MKPYPIMYYPKGKLAVVIGGGKVAERKIKRLLEAGANITVVSPEVTDYIQELSVTGQIIWKQELFHRDVLKDAVIVIAATDSKEVNKSVAESVHPAQLLNVVNEPELGNFHVPSMLSRGHLTISVATNGASPKLSRRIRDEIANTYDDRYIEYLHFLEVARSRILTIVSLNYEAKQSLLVQITKDIYRQSKVEQEAFLLSLHKLENKK